MVEFNKVSNESYFIKNLLYSTFLPILRTVRENDFIMKDRLYIYKCNIIKCTNSGYIPIKNVNLNIDEAPQKLLRKTDDEKVVIGQVYFTRINGNLTRIVGARGDTRCPRAEGWLERNIASYDILGEYYFGQRNDKFCSNFLSSSEGYDYKTHEHLGHYLRSLRDMYNLNLMPLYNCFSNQLLRNIHITSDRIEKTSKDYATKVYKVPIRFNTDYTICMDNIGMTTFAPAFIRHGTLLKLNNNRFGNGLDATNKYIKLNQGDVIHNEPNLRFKNPIVLRFDNIPQNKVIHYSEHTYTEIPSKYYDGYYRTPQSPDAFPVFRKEFRDVIKDDDGNVIGGPWLTADYESIQSELKIIKHYQPGYEFVLDDAGGSSLTPAGTEDQTTKNGFILPAIPTPEEDPEKGMSDEDILDLDFEPYTRFINGEPESVPDVIDPRREVILPTPSYELYESINPSIGSFEGVVKSYKKCPEDETIFNVNIFNNNKTKYYTYNEEYIQCTESDVYDPDTIYYYIDKEKDLGWYEFINHEFVKTEDTYIDPTKTYYKHEMTEVPMTFNYDITEENCCMYDYIEDNLFLLIQVPSVYDKDIVILEGDYTHKAKEKYYDTNRFEFFSEGKKDMLFTDHLILMETHTTKLRPFSDTLIQYLLWHVICGLDSINNDMDRLSDDLSTAAALTDYDYINTWSDKYRRVIFDYANTFPKRYIRDNLGYVTTEIEKAIKLGDDYFDGDVLTETIANSGIDELEEEE